MAEAQAKNNETLTMAIPAGSDRQINSVLEALMKKIDSMAEDIHGIKRALDDLNHREPDDLSKSRVNEPPDAFEQDDRWEPGYGPFGRAPQNLFHNIMLARMTHMMPRAHDEEFPELSELDRQDMLRRMRGPVTLSGWEHLEQDDCADLDGHAPHNEGRSDAASGLLDILSEEYADNQFTRVIEMADMLEEDRANAIADETEETEASIVDAIKSRGTLFGMLIPHADPEIFRALSPVRSEVVEVAEVAEVAEPVEVVEVVKAEHVEVAVVEPSEPPPAPKKTRKKKDPADIKPRGRKKQN